MKSFHFLIIGILLCGLLIGTVSAGVSNASDISLLHVNRSVGSVLIDEAGVVNWALSGTVADINTTQKKFGNASLYLFGGMAVTNDGTGSVLNRQLMTLDWQMLTNSLLTTGQNAIISSGAGATHGYIYPDATGNSLIYQAPGNTYVCSWYSIPKGVWNHYALQTNGTYGSCYMNGTLISSGAYTGLMFDDPTFYFGGYYGTAYLHAFIDEIRFSSIAVYGKNSYYTVPITEYLPLLPPVAAFLSFNTAGTAPFTTFFYDTSTQLNPGPVTYYWMLGDGNTSTSQSLYYNYNITGTYAVNHSVNNGIATSWKNESAYITVGTGVVAPVAAFYGGPQIGAPPLTVFLTDTSTNTPTSWNWSLGDGTFSESQNPSHIYTTSGFFTVNLTATNTAGSNTTSQSNFIMVY
jgi:PKD repeat protein